MDWNFAEVSFQAKLWGIRVPCICVKPAVCHV